MKRRLVEQLPAQTYIVNKDEKKRIKKYIKDTQGYNVSDAAFLNIYVADLDGAPHVIADIYVIPHEEEFTDPERVPGLRWACDGKTAGTVRLNNDRTWSEARLQKLIRNDMSPWYGELCRYILFSQCTEEAEEFLKTWMGEWEEKGYGHLWHGEGDIAVRTIECLIDAMENKKANKKRIQELERTKRRQQELENLEKLSHWVNPKLPQYLMYQQKRNNGDAYCTSCGKNWSYQKNAEYPFTDEWYKMNEKHECPHCGAQVTAKPVGRYPAISNRVEIIYIQHTSTGIAVRFENAVREAGWNKLLKTGYVKIRYFTDKVYYLHEREKLNNKRRKLMQKVRNNQIWVNQNGIWLYTANLKQATAGTVWGYMDLSRLAKRAAWGESIAYIIDLLRYPGYETMYKCGFWTLLYNAAWRGNQGILHPTCQRLHEAMGINREQLHRVQKMLDIDMDTLCMIQKEEEYGRLAEDQIKYLRNHADKKGILEILQYTGTYTRTINYMKKGNASGIWRDYLDMASEAGRNMTDDIVIYPRRLREMHDRLTEELNGIRLREEGESIDREYAHIEEIEDKVNQTFGYESEDLIIRAPHTAHEIRDEGRYLHHCVYANGYHRKMNKESTFILFLRKKQFPEIPFYTLEIYPDGKVAQCYGEYDRKPEWNELVGPFMDRYKKAIAKKRWVKQKGA